MAKINESVSIDAPLERVFEYMTHPENLPEIWPSMVETSNIQRSEDGSVSYDWLYKMAGVRFEGHAEGEVVEPHKKVVIRSESGIPNTFEWTYSGDDKHTDVEVSIEYSIPGKLLQKLAEPLVRRLNEHEARTFLQNLKARMELEAQQAA